jgi:predicted DNA-binding transcriptional regulator AlpA
MRLEEGAVGVAAEMRLLDVRQLAETLNMHPRSIWRLAAMADAGQGNFPKPLRIGPKTIRWRLSDVRAYLAALARERGQ